MPSEQDYILVVPGRETVQVNGLDLPQLPAEALECLVLGSTGEPYRVVWNANDNRFHCSCQHWQYRCRQTGQECKHILLAKQKGLCPPKNAKPETKRFPRGEAIAIASKIMEDIGMFEPPPDCVEIAGSYRRGRDSVADLDILIGFREHGEQKTFAIFDALSQNADRVISRGNRRFSGIFQGLQVDVEWTDLQSYGAQLLYATGSAEFNIRIRAHAKSLGFTLNRYGLWRGSELIAARTEQDIFQAIGWKYVDPQDREVRRGS